MDTSRHLIKSSQCLLYLHTHYTAPIGATQRAAPEYLTYLSQTGTFPEYLTYLSQTFPEYLTYLSQTGTFPEYLTYLSQTGTFPEQIKFAKVIPLFKSGRKSDFNNYRSISQLPQFSTILEKLYSNRLNIFTKTCDILNPYQYGFRGKYFHYTCTCKSTV